MFSKTECRKLLKPHEATLSRICWSGFELYRTGYPDISAEHSARTRPSCIHDHIVAEARRELSDLFTFMKKGQRNLFKFGEEVMFQLKKLNRRGRPSNYPTQLAMSLEENATIPLPGFDTELPLITVGYVPSPDWTTIDGIYVTHIVNRKPAWSYEIGDEGEEILPFTTPTPKTDTPNTQHAQKPVRRRIKHPDSAGGGESPREAAG